MTRHRSLEAVMLFAAYGVLATQADAAQRTFVASTGDDGNPCTLAAPCRGFGQAATQTSSGGEIVVLDSAGYGPVYITESLAIVAPAGVYAGVSVASGAGITIDGANIEVTLRGLTINGQGGTHGIDVRNAARVRIEDSVVSGMGQFGVYVRAPARVVIANSRVRRNSGHGINVLAAPPNFAHVDFDNVRIEENGDSGVFLDNNSLVVLRNSVLAANGANGLQVWPDSGETARVTVERSTISANANAGIKVQGTGASLVAVSASTIVNHAGAGAFQFASGANWVVTTVQNNAIELNASVVSGGGTLTVSSEQ